MTAFALTNSTNLSYHHDFYSHSGNAVAGPSCHAQSLEYEDRESARALERQREAASRVAAWIQTAGPITAFTLPYTSTASIGSSSPQSSASELDDLDLDEFDFELDDEPQLVQVYTGSEEDSDDLFSFPTKYQQPIIHAPIPRRASRSRSRSRSRRGHSGSGRSGSGHRPRVPSPLSLYVIQEEADSE
uniref:Uncharacterized protein n=1 Tax=Mycena chlorophos TaxID=658473 RepID=A0ABQ0LJ74_MYCCL|nr:predicted protein [Mycena chlorophos]